MNNWGIDAAWLRARVADAPSDAAGPNGEVTRLRELLERCAEGFCRRRPDVVSDRISWPRRGLRADEARSFLRAVDDGVATVDDAGYVTLPPLRPKTPAGRYALLGKSGEGVSINLEYLVQIGATAELVLDHGWTPRAIDFERGEFDALTREGERVVLAMEAKARVSGPDSLEKLVAAWLQLNEHPDADLHSNAGRKFRELVRLTQGGRVLVWLVADGARWSLWAERAGHSIALSLARSPSRTHVLASLQEGLPVLEAHPFDPSLHRPGTAANEGHCSWHGPVSCPNPPVISFQDRSGAWQSGCQRAVDELQARGEISTTGRPLGDQR